MAERAKEECPSLGGTEYAEYQDERVVLRFINAVNMWKRMTDTNDEQTAGAVVAKMSGKPKDWAFKEMKRGNARLNAWPTLRDEIKDRFIVVRGNKVWEIRQEKNEKTADFFDRVEDCTLIRFDGESDEDKATEFYRKMVKSEIVRVFVNGVKPAIKNKLISNGDDTPDNWVEFNTNDILKKALRYETADMESGLMSTNKSGGITVKQEPLDVSAMSVEQLRNEVASLRAGKKQSKKKDAIICYHCGEKGHISPKCPRSAEPQSAAGAEAEEKAKAAGKGRKKGKKKADGADGGDKAANDDAKKKEDALTNEIAELKSTVAKLTKHFEVKVEAVKVKAKKGVKSFNKSLSGAVALYMLSVMSVFSLSTSGARFRVGVERPKVTVNINGSDVEHLADSGSQVTQR